MNAVNRKHKLVAEVVEIEVAKIRPNINQARRYFDQEKIIQLAKSIKKEGQEVPIEVRPIKDERYEYEIIKGERRWRAHKVAELVFIQAIIREGISDEKAKRKSSIDNFGREGLETLEAMNMMADDLLKMKNDPDRPEEKKTREVMIQEIADTYSTSGNRVYQLLRLFNLHEDVRKMLDPKLPKEKRINFSTALAIAKCPDKLTQLEMADSAIKGRMTANQVEYSLRMTAKKTGIAYGKRKRKPSDDRAVMESFINRTSNGVERYLDLCRSNGTAEKMFKSCATGEKKKIISVIISCSDRLRELADELN